MALQAALLFLFLSRGRYAVQKGCNDGSRALQIRFQEDRPLRRQDGSQRPDNRGSYHCSGRLWCDEVLGVAGKVWD